MRTLTHGQIKAGWDALRSSKLRSFWTMLGVIIGVTSVITVVAIGEGIKQQIGGQLHRYGSNVITVRPAQLQSIENSGNSGLDLFSGLSINSPLTSRDLNVIKGTHGVSATAPLTITPGTVSGDNGNYKDGLVIGTTPDLPSLLNQSLAYGVFIINEDIGDNVAVLGSHAADKLFNEDVPLGRSFTFHGKRFIVHGIFNQFVGTPLNQQADLNNAIFIPYDVSQSLTKNTAPTYAILARTQQTDQTNRVAAAIKHNLSQSRGGESSFSVLTGNQNLAASNSILDLLTKLIAGIATVSLVVGGIGIMNVMLVAVAERMHEIGIRKAVGATNRQILSQFMIESSLLTLTGGVIGILLSFLIDLVLRLTTTLTPVISWQIVLLASGVSLLVGVIFGTIPAVKAARKAPIEALRSE